MNNAEYSKLWRKKHKKEKADYDKQYYQQHKQECRERLKKWRADNPIRIKELDIKYKNGHRKEINYKQKERYKSNPDKYKEIVYKWIDNNRYKANKLWKKHQAKRKRQLGYNELNERFEGSEGHHINKNDVIYIPSWIHQTIRHNHTKIETMNKINILAWDILETQNY